MADLIGKVPDQVNLDVMEDVQSGRKESPESVQLLGKFDTFEI